MITLKKKFSDSYNFLYNKKAIVRVDLNIPITNGKIVDDTRIQKIIPTIKILLEKKASIVLITHLGRPNGNWDEKFSLKEIASEVSLIIGEEIYFEKMNINKIESEYLDNLFKDFKIVLLENIRFYKEEEKNDKKFVKKISSFGDVFINECFSCCHRNHASISGIPTYLPSFPGKLLEDEILNLKNLVLSSNIENNIAVLGGAKISTKLKIIDFYAKNYSQVIIGGAMANTFLSALGNEIGNSLYEKKMVKTATDLLSIYGDKILLPKDVVVTSKKDENLMLIKNIDEVEKDHVIMDIGPQTRMSFYNEIIKAENLLWNGPLGFFEKTPFDAGTNYVLKGVKNNKFKNFFSVAGGGDTISLLKKGGFFNCFSFVSTGGGAFLEFIQRGNSLPGLNSLNN
ncbi:MAG: phosphoglycerate kinase [Rickettsiales bacterium]|nr:phosphoglycerate kinase [Rickettsiales bacterium]OUT43120.1 MAG: phosphoglycerate kinase [Pelagibacteraceae bacterium TMED13]